LAISIAGASTASALREIPPSEQSGNDPEARAFLFMAPNALRAFAWPLAANAQRLKKVPRVGVLWHAGSAEKEEVYLSALRKGFSDLGYIEGKLDNRFPAEEPERCRTLAENFSKAKST
jgi:hypothetical protein